MNGTSNSIHMSGLQPQAWHLKPSFPTWKQSGDRSVASAGRISRCCTAIPQNLIYHEAVRSERRPGAVSAVGDARRLHGPVGLLLGGRDENLGARLNLGF